MKKSVLILFVVLIFDGICISGTGTLPFSALTPRQIEIIQIVLNTDGGYISKELHSEFWGLIQSDISIIDLTRVVPFIEKQLVIGMQFQRECWTSMKKSIEAGKVIKTPEYELTKEDFIFLALPEAKDKVQSSIIISDAMIEAAGKNTPFKSSRGTIYITPELVNKVLSGLDASFFRSRRLINPKWNQEIREYLYPEAHIAVLSDSPYVVEKKNLVSENQKGIELITLTNQLDKNSAVCISFSHHGFSLSDSKGAIIRNAKSILTGTGATISTIYSSPWRGQDSVQGEGALKTSDGIFYISVRTVELREQKGILSFMAGSDTSKIETDLMREQLEQSIQIIR